MSLTTSPAPRLAPTERGTLTVTKRAATRLTLGALVRNGLVGADPQADVLALDDDGVDVRATITLVYPTVSLSSVLRDLRATAATELERLLGRPVRRFDLVVAALMTEPAARRRAM